MSNDRPHPGGESWKRALTDQELDRLYRMASAQSSGSGGGSSRSGGGNGCLIALVGFCTVLTVLASWWLS